MKWMSACAALLLAACGGGGTGSNATNVPPTGPLSAGRSYNAAASVGDFLTVTVDPTAQTIAYSDKSNDDSGIIPFTINSSDGSYSLNDPAGNFTTAYEIPGFGMVLAAQKAGPNHNTAALVTAVASAPISLSSWAASSYNVVQFRTNNGGVAAGS